MKNINIIKFVTNAHIFIKDLKIKKIKRLRYKTEQRATSLLKRGKKTAYKKRKEVI